MPAHAGELVLALTRVLSAPPPIVFKAFSDADQLRRWWGPAGFTVPAIEYEPRLGETYRIEMQPPEGDAFYLTGEFRAVEPPVRLAYTFIWEYPDPDDVETLVELSFRALGEATGIALTQGRFRSEARRHLHRDGWTESFDKLEKMMSG
jgi:uncharacterized protein YndB with AHSA1/START domain